MPAGVQPSLLIERLRRGVAAGCVLLVCALAVFAASPGAHGALHEGENCRHGQAHDQADETCPVVMFANGVPVSLDGLSVGTPPGVALACAPAAPEEIFLVAARYLRQPERGPPSAV